VKELIINLKKLNHAWLCTKGKCLCEAVTVDSSDLGNRIIQEMWNKELRRRRGDGDIQERQ